MDVTTRMMMDDNNNDNYNNNNKIKSGTKEKSKANVITQTFIDEISGNEFQIQQAKGLPPGERALVFIRSSKFGNIIPKGEFLCGYSNDLIIMKQKDYDSQGHAHDTYAVQAKKGIVVLPERIIPDHQNLGAFANAPLKHDIFRLQSNAQLRCLWRSHFPSGIRVYLKSIKEIKSGQEILISYGRKYTYQLNQSILQAQKEIISNKSNEN